MTPEDVAARWREETERLALAFVGEPDEKVEAALADFADRISAAWADVFPEASADNLAEIAGALVSEVQARRRQIEAIGAPFASARSAAGSSS